MHAGVDKMEKLKKKHKEMIMNIGKHNNLYLLGNNPVTITNDAVNSNCHKTVFTS